MISQIVRRTDDLTKEGIRIKLFGRNLHEHCRNLHEHCRNLHEHCRNLHKHWRD
jgi:hypothetical protein